MPFLKEQVNIINTHLRTRSLKDNRFQGGRFISLARLAIRQGTDKQITQPVEMNNNYEAAWVGIDDTYPLIVYHRKLGSAYTTIKQAQFGRGNSTVQETSDMLMIVYGKWEKIKITSEQLEAQIVASFPDNINPVEFAGLGLSLMQVNLSTSSSDSEVVFANEYRNVDFKLAPEDILISVRYNIVTQFNKNCYDFCCEQ